MASGVGLWLIDSEGKVFRFLGAVTGGEADGSEYAESLAPEEQWKEVKGRLKRLSATRECAWGLTDEGNTVVYVHSTYIPIRVEEETYETEHRGLGRSGTISWTNADDSEQRPRDSFTLPSPNWEWEQAWDIDKDHVQTDDEGWYWPSRFVRRRRWIRHRRYAACDSFAKVTGIEGEAFQDIAVGGNEVPGQEEGCLNVWAVTIYGKVVFREGVTRLTPEGSTWRHIPSERLDVLQISVGPTGIVWALNWDGAAMVRVGVTRERPIGTRWIAVFAPDPMHSLQNIAVGANVVWAISVNDTVWFRKGVRSARSGEDERPEGTHWIEMYGKCCRLSIGPHDQLYAIGPNNWPLLVRDGISGEELGGQSWRDLHGDLGHEVYLRRRRGTFDAESAPLAFKSARATLERRRTLQQRAQQLNEDVGSSPPGTPDSSKRENGDDDQNSQSHSRKRHRSFAFLRKGPVPDKAATLPNEKMLAHAVGDSKVAGDNTAMTIPRRQGRRTISNPLDAKADGEHGDESQHSQLSDKSFLSSTSPSSSNSDFQTQSGESCNVRVTPEMGNETEPSPPTDGRHDKVHKDICDESGKVNGKTGLGKNEKAVEPLMNGKHQCAPADADNEQQMHAAASETTTLKAQALVNEPRAFPVATKGEMSKQEFTGAPRFGPEEPAHPVLGVHKWAWLSAGGSVPPQEDVSKPGAFLGSGLTAAVTLQRTMLRKRRQSAAKKTGWRKEILQALKDRNAQELDAFRDLAESGEEGVWSKRGILHWCVMSATTPPSSVTWEKVTLSLNRGSSRVVRYLELFSERSLVEKKVLLSDITCVVPVPASKTGQNYCFVIHTPQQLAANEWLVCRADGQAGRDDWLTAICNAVMRVHGLDGPPAPNALWALTQDGDVYISDPPRVPTSPHERRWRPVGGHLKSISAGASGVVWGIGYDGMPWAYNGGFGGGVFQQSVDSSSSNLQEQTDSLWFHLYEVQHWRPGVGWSTVQWEDDNGNVGEKRQAALPSKAWKWTSNWIVDFSSPNVDSDGFMSQAQDPKKSVRGRRRRCRLWKRCMAFTTSGPWQEILPCPNKLAIIAVQTSPTKSLRAHDHVAVWAVSMTGDVIFRFGVTAAQPQGEGWRWVSSNKPFVSISAGGSCSVWGVGQDGCAYVRLGISDVSQCGKSWKKVSPPGNDRFVEVAVGNGRVWARTSKNELWFRSNAAPSDLANSSWIKRPGTARHLSLSATNQLWAVTGGAIRKLGNVTPEKPEGSGSWDVALQPSWSCISAGATDVVMSPQTRTAASSHEQEAALTISFDEMSAGTSILVKGKNMFWCPARLVLFDPDTEKLLIEMTHEAPNVRWCTLQQVTLNVPPPEEQLEPDARILYKYNWVGERYYKDGTLVDVNHLDNSYKIASAVQNVARTREDLRLLPETLIRIQEEQGKRQAKDERAIRAAARLRGANSFIRRKAANISEAASGNEVLNILSRHGSSGT